MTTILSTQATLSICDQPILKYNEEGKLVILDDTRSVGELLIGQIQIENDEQIKCVNNAISPLKFKTLFNDKIELMQPELFIQVVMSKMTHLPQNGWVQEKRIDNSEKRLDHALVIQDQIIGFNEYKSASVKDDYKQIIEKTFYSQVFDYLKIITNNKNNTNQVLASIYVYDGNYFFNNPHLLNNIPHYIINNQPFFKTVNFSYDNTKKYKHDSIFEETINKSKGVIDCLTVEKYNNDKDYDNITIYVTPNEIIKPNRFSNPRAEQRADTIALGENIIQTMINCVKAGQNYHSTKYTQQKQINVIGELFSIQKEETIIYGHGLSLANGQHSSVAYSIIYDLIFNDNAEEFYKEKIYNKLCNKAIELKEEINKNGKRKANAINKQLKKGIILQAKITTAETKEEEVQVANASNSTVSGKVDTEISRFVPLLIKMNDELIKDGANIQFNYPRCPKIEGYEYIGYEVLITLRNLDRFSNTMAKFRSNGTKKDFDAYKTWLFELAKENKKIKDIKKDIENIKEQIEEKKEYIDSVESNNDQEKYKKQYDSAQEDMKNLSKTKLDLEIELSGISNYEYNLETKNTKTNYQNILIFNKFFNKVEADNKLLAAKLASGLAFQKAKLDKNAQKNDIIITENIVKVANFLSNKNLVKDLQNNYGVDMGVKNGIFNVKQINDELQALIMRRVGEKDFKVCEIAELLISLKKMEIEELQQVA